MINATANIRNNNSLSFKRGLPSNYTFAETIIRNYCNKGLKSSTEYTMRFPNLLEKEIETNREFFRNNINKKIYTDIDDSIIQKYIRKKELLALRIPRFENFINYYRHKIMPLLYYETENDYYLTLKNLVNKFGALNCGDCAQLVHYELKKQKIPSRIVSDIDIDHSFVIVNRKEPFVTYRDKKPNEFIADLWLKRNYKSIDEAYVDFRNRFDTVSNANFLIDSTDNLGITIKNKPLTKREKEYNKQMLAELDKLWGFLEENTRAQKLKKQRKYLKNNSAETIIEKYCKKLTIDYYKHLHKNQ